LVVFSVKLATSAQEMKRKKQLRRLKRSLKLIKIFKNKFLKALEAAFA